ncbi:hypothetical protein WMF41_06150 [Sorangium sp. So ce1151]
MLDPAQSGCPDCNCWGGSLPVGGPLPGSVGTWNQDTPIGRNIQSVGAYIARSIKSTTATVDCTDGRNNSAVHEEIGKGHVVAYGDEWVTCSGQWLGTATCLDAQMYTDPNSPCYQRSAAAADHEVTVGALALFHAGARRVEAVVLVSEPERVAELVDREAALGVVVAGVLPADGDVAVLPEVERRGEDRVGARVDVFAASSAGLRWNARRASVLYR